MSQESQSPQPVNLPEAPQHPSEPSAVSYQDPDAPKPKRKLRVGRILLVILLLAVLIGGGVFAYIKFVQKSDDNTIIESYDGGLSEDTPTQSVNTPETEAGRLFLKAVQTQDTVEVNNYASDELKSFVRTESGSEEQTVAEYYQNQFSNIDIDSLIASEENLENGNKKVTFTDASVKTYTVELEVVQEGEALRILSVAVNLEL